jgi:hypothetical protein
VLAEAPVIGFIPVGDFDVAEGFYAGKLGLSVASRDGFALVLLAAGGVAIRCVAMPGFVPKAFTIFGWEVPDLAASVKELKGNGIEPLLYPHFEQSEDGIWTAPGGDRVAWFNDPFMNVLSLSQHVGATK